LLLCYPRLLGCTSNPLSVYFCYRADGDLAVLIYEVRNTFGDIHAYALAVKPDGISGAGVRQQQDKLLCLAVYRDGDALPLPGFAAGRRCQTAHSRDRPQRPSHHAARAKAAFDTGLAIDRRADYTGPTLSAAGRESLGRGKALWSGELRIWRQSVHAKLGRRAISRDESANAGADFSYPRQC
jgi:hypothetical protein